MGRTDQKTTISDFVKANNAKHVDGLSTEAQILFNLLTLIVEIRYRHKYGKTVEQQRGKSYSDDAQSNNVLADQLPPVDNGLLGH